MKKKKIILAAIIVVILIGGASTLLLAKSPHETWTTKAGCVNPGGSDNNGFCRMDWRGMYYCGPRDISENEGWDFDCNRVIEEEEEAPNFQ